MSLQCSAAKAWRTMDPELPGSSARPTVSAAATTSMGETLVRPKLYHRDPMVEVIISHERLYGPHPLRLLKS